MVMNSFQSDGCFQIISISPLSFGNSWVFKVLRCNFCVSFGILGYLRCAIILFSNINNTSKEKKNVAKYILAASFFLSVGFLERQLLIKRELGLQKAGLLLQQVSKAFVSSKALAATEDTKLKKKK